jgi:hypothetical protein
MELPSDTISIRMATPDDTFGIVRLAALDSAEVPAGPLLLAERGGDLQAALALRDGTTIADPFAATADLLALMHMRAARLRPRPVLSARLRGVLSSRRGPRAYAA